MASGSIDDDGDMISSVHIMLSVSRMVGGGCVGDGWGRGVLVYSASAAFLAFVKRRDARGLGHSSVASNFSGSSFL